MSSHRPHPLVVIILDGWGISFIEAGNAIAQAKTPSMDSYAQYYPSAAIHAAGIEVGLPWGEIGNSETGHRNIGAGKVQYQLLPQIDSAISSGAFWQNPVLQQAIAHAQKHDSNLHLLGLLSPGGVHSHMNHLFALLELCARSNLRERVYIHVFTDGRDTQPQSALTYLENLENAIGKHGVGKIASVSGRFFAMDRNKNWDRTEASYNVLTGGPRTSGAPSPRQAIAQAYRQNIFDEMIPPTAITRGGEPIATIQDNDAAIFINFRPDRARQLTAAFVHPASVGFKTLPLKNINFATMAQYDSTIPAPAAFLEDVPEFTLARVIADAKYTQLHIAETEKYAHVTYYLNVGHEEPYPGQKNVLIPSTAASNFAKEPQMQAGPITDHVVAAIQQGVYDVYFINFANADMVGHTGDLEATMEACSFVDQCLGRIEQAATSAGGALLITADHGNAEEMINPKTNEVEKDHDTNPVPLHYVWPARRRTTPKSLEEVADLFSSPIGVLADIAPTILDILDLEKPESMTGVSLLSSLR